MLSRPILAIVRRDGRFFLLSLLSEKKRFRYTDFFYLKPANEISLTDAVQVRFLWSMKWKRTVLFLFFSWVKFFAFYEGRVTENHVWSRKTKQNETPLANEHETKWNDGTSVIYYNFHQSRNKYGEKEREREEMRRETRGRNKMVGRNGPPGRTATWPVALPSFFYIFFWFFDFFYRVSL